MIILCDYVSLSGEDLDGGILNSYVLEADEALVLSAVDHFDDDSVKSECALQTSHLEKVCLFQSSTGSCICMSSCSLLSK